MKAISLHVGLNLVNPRYYAGWDGELAGCENDARDMAILAKEAGYNETMILTSSATKWGVIDEINDAADQLQAGDFFLMTYSGHGGQVIDDNGDELDGMDETWCFYDGQLLDDEMKKLWSKFREGVRILVLSDSCHSGSIVRNGRGEFLTKAETNPNYKQVENITGTPKFLPNGIASRTKVHRYFSEVQPEIMASIILISGCQDNQFSYDGPVNGAFTTQVLKVWNDGLFAGTHKNFHREIQKRLPDYQSPNLLIIGRPDIDFENMIPFSPNTFAVAKDENEEIRKYSWTQFINYIQQKLNEWIS